jgi:hypothetical protein
MMFFRTKAPSPAGSAVDLSPQGEVKGVLDVAQRHLSLRGRGRPGRPGDGAFAQTEQSFSAQSCAIWNDIRRALEGDKK